MSTVPEGVKQPADRKAKTPRAPKPRVHHLTIDGVEVALSDESLNDADYLYLASAEEYDSEDLQILVNLLVRMVGKPAYRALLAVHRAKAKGGRAGFDVNGAILNTLMTAVAEASEPAGN